MIRRLLVLVPAIVCSLAAQGQVALAQTPLSGTVTQTREGAVRIKYTEGNGATAAVGDSVRFTMTMDGFELDAGTGKVSESADGFVWVAVSDARVRVGADARILATGIVEAAAIQTGEPEKSGLRGQLDDYIERRHSLSITGEEREEILQKLMEETPEEERSADAEALAAEVYFLGSDYLYGSSYAGIEEDWRKGITYIYKAAEQEDPGALTSMGNFHRLGEYGLERDVMLAIEFYQAAMEKGYAYAFASMSLLYFCGIGVPFSDADGERLLSELGSYVDDDVATILRLSTYTEAAEHWRWHGNESRAQSYYTKACRLGSDYACGQVDR